MTSLSLTAGQLPPPHRLEKCSMATTEYCLSFLLRSINTIWIERIPYMARANVVFPGSCQPLEQPDRKYKTQLKVK
jgi:hypothetical protein